MEVSKRSKNSPMNKSLFGIHHVTAITSNPQRNWVQNILHNSKVSFSVNSMTFEGVARIVNREKESELAAEVSKQMNTKYGWNKGVIVELITH
jgi:hypothetical protein